MNWFDGQQSSVFSGHTHMKYELRKYSARDCGAYSVYVYKEELQGPILLNDRVVYAEYRHSNGYRDRNIAIELGRYYENIFSCETYLKAQPVKLRIAGIVYYKGSNKIMKQLRVVYDNMTVENEKVVCVRVKRECRCTPPPLQYADMLEDASENVKNMFVCRCEHENGENENNKCESGEHESSKCKSGEHESSKCESNEHESSECENSECENSKHESNEHESNEHESNEHRSNEPEHRYIHNYYIIDDKTVFIRVGQQVGLKKVYLNRDVLLKTYAVLFNSLYFSDKLRKLLIEPVNKVVLVGEVGTGKRTFCRVMNSMLNADINVEVYKRVANSRYEDDEYNLKDKMYEVLMKDNEMSYFIVNEDKQINFYELGNVCVIRFERPDKETVRRILEDYGLEDIKDEVQGLNYYEIFNLIREVEVTNAISQHMSTEDDAGNINKKMNDLSLTASGSTVIDEFLEKIGKKTRRNRNETFTNIGGYQEIKDILSECLVRTHPNLIDYPRGILLYGPPGCSKTLFARTLSATFNYNFVYFSGSSIKSMWVGESERRLRKKFQEAEMMQPSLLFIDEIDAIAGHRDKLVNQHEISLVNMLLSLMDGIDKRQTVVFGSTNRRDGIDRALLRPGRFDKHVYIGLPNEHDRYEILKLYMEKEYASDECADNKENMDVKEQKCTICLRPASKTKCCVNLLAIAQATDKMSGAELKAAVNEGKMLFAKKYKDDRCRGIDWTGMIMDGVSLIKKYMH